MRWIRSDKAVARLAGLLYLLMAVTAGIAGAIRTSVLVPGDPVASAARIRASVELFRVGIVVDLVQATCFLLTAMVLYVLLRNVGRLAAAAMVILVAVSATIQAVNLLMDVAALTLATGGGYAGLLGQTNTDALAGLFLGLQHDGFLVSQMFFGLWLVPLGYLVVKSGFIPKALGFLLIAACVGYLADLAAYFVVPTLERSVLPFSAILGAGGELSFLAWLLVKGVRSPNGPATTLPSALAPLPAGAER